jgi:hypothetical protein
MYYGNELGSYVRQILNEGYVHGNHVGAGSSVYDVNYKEDEARSKILKYLIDTNFEKALTVGYIEHKIVPNVGVVEIMENNELIKEAGLNYRNKLKEIKDKIFSYEIGDYEHGYYNIENAIEIIRGRTKSFNDEVRANNEKAEKDKSIKIKNITNVYKYIERHVSDDEIARLLRFNGKNCKINKQILIELIKDFTSLKKTKRNGARYDFEANISNYKLTDLGYEVYESHHQVLGALNKLLYKEQG